MPEGFCRANLLAATSIKSARAAAGPTTATEARWKCFPRPCCNCAARAGSGGGDGALPPSTLFPLDLSCRNRRGQRRRARSASDRPQSISSRCGKRWARRYMKKKTGSFVIALVKRSIGEHVSFDKCIDPARLPVEGALIASSCHVASTASACLPRRGCRRPPWTRFVPVVGLPRRPFRPLPPGFFPAHLPPDFFPPLFSSPSLLLHLVVSSVAQPKRWLPSSPAVPALVSRRRLRLLPLFTPPPPFTPAPPCTLPPPPRCPLWAAPPPPPTAV